MLISCGNLINKDFFDIWENSNFLASIRSRVPKSEEACGYCKEFAKCRGGCIANSETKIVKKTMYVNDPVCSILHNMKRGSDEANT